MELRINGRRHAVAPEWQGEMLLHVLREHLGLVGSKFGCGVGLCGACTVLLDGVAARSCVLPVGAAVGQALTTIEGLAGADGRLHPLQQAWLDAQVPQCGYCQAGQLMSAAALLHDNPRPDAAACEAAMSGNLCRCGTQHRIRTVLEPLVQGLPWPVSRGDGDACGIEPQAHRQTGRLGSGPALGPEAACIATARAE
jgi:isoquinoline 1-oxidoreductase subunit alpha